MIEGLAVSVGGWEGLADRFLPPAIGGEYRRFLGGFDLGDLVGAGLPPGEMFNMLQGISGNPDYNDRLGFNSDLAPNQHYNFVHFAGIAASRGSQFGNDRFIQQLEEDLAQLDAARNSDAQELPERCAEVTMDLLTIQFLNGVKSNLRGRDTTGVRRFLTEFNLRSKLCSGYDFKCDCVANEKQLREELNKAKAEAAG